MLKFELKHFLPNIILVFVLLCPQIIFANSPPNLISPPDNSILSESPKLTWEYSGECVQSGSCFLVEADNDSDFSSKEKSTYTNSLSYSPKSLGEGTWFWRVKAKDKSAKWSDWSKVFKFIINPSAPSASPESPDPAPEAKSEKKSGSDFNIKNTPPEINSDEEFEVFVSLTLPDKPNASFFLKGAFKKDGSSNYFGRTYVSDWVNNSSKFSNQLKINLNDNGVWEGKIKVKPDSEDSGFEGSGEYIFKTGRYSDSGQGPLWSNEAKIRITAVSNPQPSAEGIIDEPQEEREVEDFQGSLVKAYEKENFELKIASVAGISQTRDNTPSEKPQVLGERKINWFLVVSGIVILLGGGSFAAVKLKGKINAESLH